MAKKERKASKTSKLSPEVQAFYDKHHQMAVDSFCNQMTDMITDTCAKAHFSVAQALSLPIQLICTMIRDNYEREESDEVKDMVFKSISAGLEDLYAEELQHEIH